MALWGKTSGTESRPKSLPMDSNSGYSREFVTATSKGWVMQPGVASAATGNDNTSADPEILVAIRNLSVTFKSGNLLSIDWTDGAYADAADFDLVLTFDENITVTSATATANQTVTNKVYILLNELGATDMASDGTIACQYYSGSGTNTLTFRGRRSQTAAGYVAFYDNYIHVNGTATMQSDSETFGGILSETDGGQSDDSIVLDASSGASGTVNGAITASTTVTVDGVSGTIATGQVVTVNGAGSTPAASITATEDSDTGISTDNTLTITAVEDQTEFTVSEPITVANDINLLFSADAGEGCELNAISMSLEGADGATSVVDTTAYRTGFGVDTIVGRVGLLEDSDQFLVNEDGTGNKFSAEEYTTDASGLVVETKVGTTSGSASVLKGVTMS
tara:strand:+ start:2567 stop:3748 length:1182 start_codon:yes stop_codon:yes gene_type:complete